MNEAKTVYIPLQPMITIGDSHNGSSVELPAGLLEAIDAWLCIRDDESAERVGKVIQARIDALQTPV